jgi:outer membrane cobalamin receptor
MNKQSCILFWLFLLLLLEQKAQENDTSRLFRANVREMLELKGNDQQEQTASIGSFKDAKVREIPGIITVLDNEFIQNSGARDLTDLLRLVPGMDFARDVDDVVGIAVRGNWALEGKVLVMINGVSVNETGYGSFVFKGRLHTANIEKIEIVRGPGSTIYGGVASLAVINIITRSTRYNDGVELSIEGGYSDGGVSGKKGAVNFAHKFNNGSLYNFSSYINHSNISNITYTNERGQEINYKDSSGIANEGFISTFQYKNFSHNFIYDNYVADISENPSRLIMKNLINQISYNLKAGKLLSFRPEFTHKWSYPWNYQDGNREQNDALTTINNRSDFKLSAFFNPNPNVLFSAGGQYYIDYSRYPAKAVTFYDSSNSARFTNTAAFAETQLFTKFFNLTVGARYEKLNSSLELGTVPEAFVPRFAITKAFKYFHLKALYSNAYKIPTIQNINASLGNIKPEEVQVIEFEAGARLSNMLSLNLNVFDNQIRNPIVFGYNTITATEEYFNKTLIYNRGAEAELMLKSKVVVAQANFSTYFNYKNEVDETFIDTVQTPDLAGLARFKASFYLNFNLPKNWRINTNFIHTSARKSYVYTDSLLEVLEVREIKPYNLLNFSVSKSNFFLPQLRLDICINNLLNQTYFYLNTLNNGFDFLPEQRFEAVIRLTYKIGM